MQKTDALRAWLVASIPDLADASRFLVFIDKGSLRSTGVPGAGGRMGVEYAYTVTLLMLDFAGDMDAVSFAIVAWAGANQPELLQNFERNRSGIPFECDILDGGKVDLQIQLELTEAILATPRTGPGQEGYDITHLDEPAQAGVEPWLSGPAEPPMIGSLYANGELIAELPAG